MNIIIDYQIHGRELTPIQGKDQNRINGRFYVGIQPWNKGMKGLQMGGKQTQFKNGQPPVNHRELYSTRISKDGYIEVKVAEPRKWMLLHRAMWIDLYGPIPKGMIMRCMTDDKTNCLPSNWMLITRQQHVRLNYDAKKTSDTMKRIWKRERIRFNLGLAPVTGLGRRLQKVAI
jgi:hypothetical protein